MNKRRWMSGLLGRALLGSTLGVAMAACCDNDARLTVHVVDGETGYVLAMPTITAGGETLFCNDDSFGYYAEPVPTPGVDIDGGGVVVPAPGGSDMGVRPPPQSQWCQTYVASLEPGSHTVKATAPGYFPTSVQVDMGEAGDSVSCGDAKDIETTIALYRRPQ